MRDWEGHTEGGANIMLEILFGRHDQHDRDMRKLIEALHTLATKVDRLMATQEELATALNALNQTVTDIGTEVDKVSGETTSLLAQVATLTQELQNQQGGTSPAVDQALAAVQTTVQSLAAKVKAVDDLVPDAPAPTPPTA